MRCRYAVDRRKSLDRFVKKSPRPAAPPHTSRARPLTPVTHDVGAGSAAGRDVKPRLGGRTGMDSMSMAQSIRGGGARVSCPRIGAADSGSGSRRASPLGLRTRHLPERCSFVLHLLQVLRIKESALRHGLTRENISHAYDMAIFGDVLDPEHDPPKLLFIGPDEAANLLELIGGDVESGDRVIWHADRLSSQYDRLLPKAGGSR
jgi:hypothetical protein